MSITAILLWLVSILVGGFFFVKGQTKMGADERDFVLTEKRVLLEGVQSMAVHKQFDQIANKAGQRAPANEILSDLSELLGSCVACHSVYRLDAEAGVN